MSTVNVLKNVSLEARYDLLSLEPTAAKGDNCVFFTLPHSFRLSTDSGSTFQSFAWASPNAVFPGASTDWFGDNSTIWVPQTKRFMWLLNHAPTMGSTQQIRLAFTSSSDMKNTQGQYWVWLDIDPSTLGVTDSFDYSQLAVGENFLYITTYLASSAGVLGVAWIRIALRDLVAWDANSVGIEYFVSRSSSDFGMAQRCGSRAYWASHEKKSNLLRVYFIDESSASIAWQDIAIPVWNNLAYFYQSRTPDGFDWMGIPSARITGTFFAPDTLVFGWTAASDGTSERPHPYIYLVQLKQDLKTNKFTLVGIHHIFNSQFAWAFPGLSSVPSAGREGPLAISCGWGGGDLYFANHAVGFIDLPLSGTSQFISKTVSKSTMGYDRWGDFLTVGNDEFEAHFLTAGYEIKSGGRRAERIAVPHYVVFSPF